MRKPYYRIDFRGSETDRWHQWATRKEQKEAEDVFIYLLDRKKVYDARITTIAH